MLQEGDDLSKCWAYLNLGVPQMGSHTMTPPPLIPVRVFNIDTNTNYVGYVDMELSLARGGYAQTFYNPLSTQINNNKISDKIFPGQENVRGIYYMTRDQLATVKLIINFPGSVTPLPVNIWLNHIAYDADNNAYVDNPIINCSETNQSAANPCVINQVVPSIPNLPSTAIQIGGGTDYGPQINATVQYQGNVVGYEKTLIGGVVNYHQIANADLNTTFPIETNAPFIDTDWTETVSVVNGTFLSGRHNVIRTPYYAALPASFMILPSQTQTFSITMGTQDGYYPSRVWVTPNSDWSSEQDRMADPYCVLFNSQYFNPAIYSNAMPVKITRIGTSAQIYGKVLDADGTPVLGAVVTLWRTGKTPPSASSIPPSTAPFEDLTFNTVDDACSTCGADGPYQFVFDKVAFVEHDWKNLKLTVSAPGYDTATAESDGYQNVTWHKDFILIRTPSPIAASAGDL
jgi:hypothetical protein